MNINIKVNKDFENFLTDLETKYGEDFEILNGFHESQLNFSDFIDGFVDKNVADVTIDGNANAHHKDICSLMGEKGKSEDKLFAFNKIFYEIKKKYGLRTSKEWLEAEYNGAFYLHDAPSSTFKPYCYAFDLTRLATEGLFFLEGYNNQPPKHLTTFLDDVIEFISFMSNRSSGACGIPNVLLWTFYFYKKDLAEGYYIKDKDYYLKQCFQKFIYRINQPFLRVDQSAFVNVSIFDRPYFESLFGGVQFPDGTFAIDYEEEFIEHQKIFMEVISEIRNNNLFTFPVK
jgi:ribonucleoside-triphosphate reductase